MNESDIIAGCIRGDRSCQEMLYRKFADKMYGISLSYMKSESDACDTMQEAFITVFRKIHTFKNNGGSLEGWVRRIVVNKCIDSIRSKKSKGDFISDLNSNIASVVDWTIEKFAVNDIINKVNELPEKAALILKLYAIEGYTHKEIAESLEISEGTSKSQLNRARTLLEQSLKEE